MQVGNLGTIIGVKLCIFYILVTKSVTEMTCAWGWKMNWTLAVCMQWTTGPSKHCLRPHSNGQQTRSANRLRKSMFYSLDTTSSPSSLSRLKNRVNDLPQFSKSINLPPYRGYKRFWKALWPFSIKSKSCNNLMRLLNPPKYLSFKKSDKTIRDGLEHNKSK
jgi:hypothetical protein